ncbi:MAG: hypothetical protein K2Y17_06595 [Qipengyuania sp.]|nr:hypothetical protein [Qipengyuania sp.]
MAETKRRRLALARAANVPEQDPTVLFDESDPLARQRRYIAEQTKKGGGLGLVFVDAFIRGMRKNRYKTPAWAIA